jgi:hypothetical protein
MIETRRMREGAVLFASWALWALWALVLGPELLRAQERPPEAGREAAAHLRATLLATPVGSQLTIALRSVETVEASLADVGDDSFGVWVAADEEAQRRLGLTGARIKRRILYDEVESIRGAADVAVPPERTADRLAYRMRFGDTVYVRTANGATVKGKVDDFDGDILRIDDRTLSLSGAEGDRIERIDLRVEDSLKNGVLLGAGIGASLVLVCLTEDCGGGGSAAVGATLYAGIGAGLGALFDILLNDRELIYVAPVSPSGPKLLAAPILSRDRKGILISISF